MQWHRRRHGLELRSDLFVTFPGVLTAIAILIRELTEERDGVLIQVPAYHQFEKVISTAGREVLRTALIHSGGVYNMDFNDLDAKPTTYNQ